jgi:hypothetical protein
MMVTSLAHKEVIIDSPNGLLVMTNGLCRMGSPRRNPYMKPLCEGRIIMRLKKLIVATSVAAALSSAALNASAGSILADPISGSSFSDVLLGTIHIASLSDLTGSLFAAGRVDYPSFALTLDNVSFTSGSVTPNTATKRAMISLLDSNPSASGFSFHNVAAGDYLVRASGTLGGNGQIKGLAFIGADYTVTAVPEPESYAMLLAGLGLMATIARRRSKDSKS